MSRIELLPAEQAPLKVRSYYAGGYPGALGASLAQVPELMEKAMPFIGAIYGPSGVSQREKEIVVLRVSGRMRCKFCVETHSVIALAAGLSREEVMALRDDEDAVAAFDVDQERALIRWSDALASPEPVPQSLAAAMKTHFADWELVEFTMIGSATLMLNRYCTALEIPTSEATLLKLQQEKL